MNQISDNTQNPLLQRARIPGETFTLPSKGMLYSNGELDQSVVNGEIMVNPMVTIDELIFKTPDRLLNGTAIIEVFSRCIPQVLKPLDLFAKDLEYLLVCLRKITYGNEYEILHTHNCDDKEYHYLIPLDDLLTKSKLLNPHSVSKEYTLTLDNGQVVKLEPPRYSQVISFFQEFDSNNTEIPKPEDMAVRLLTDISNIIVSVDNVTDKQQIFDWLSVLKSGEIKKIGKTMEEASTWGTDLTVHFECKNCKETLETNISLNPISFFS